VASDERDRLSQIPWKQIIGTRHRIVHDYIHVDTDILWEIVSVHIPELRELLAAVLE